MQFVSLPDTPAHELVSGVRMRALFGQGAMLNLVDLDPGAVVPAHSHPQEQFGYIISGELLLTVDGVLHRLGPNDAYQFAGGIEHAAVAGDEGCRVLDVFQPVREDYRKLASG